MKGILILICSCWAVQAASLRVTNLRIAPTWVHYDALPAGITGTNLGTVRVDPGGGFLVRSLVNGAASIDMFGASPTKDSTTNIQAALVGNVTDSRITKVTAISGTYPISAELHLSSQQAGLTLDFGSAWLLMTNQSALPRAMLTIWACGVNSDNPTPYPGTWTGPKIVRLNLDGGLLGTNQTAGGWDELYLDSDNVGGTNLVVLKKQFNGLLVYAGTITDPTRIHRIDGMTIGTLQVQNIGGDAFHNYWPIWNFHCTNLVVNRCSFFAIDLNKGISGVAYSNVVQPSYIFDSIAATNANMAFDFSSNGAADDPDERMGSVLVKQLYVDGAWGRPKIQGNWDATILNMDAKNVGARYTLTTFGGLYDPDWAVWYGAINIVNKYFQGFHVGTLTCSNCVSAALQVASGVVSNVVVTNLFATNCYRAVSDAGSAAVTVKNLTADGCWQLANCTTVENFYWTRANEDVWARFIGNGTGSGGASDDTLYSTVIAQGTERNSLSRSGVSYAYSHGTVTNIGPVASFRAIATKARSGNVATLTTGLNHRLQNGDLVAVTDMADATFNTASATVTVVDGTTFSYSNTGGNVAQTAVAAGEVNPLFCTIQNNDLWFVSNSAHATFDHITYAGDSNTDANWTMFFSYQAGTLIDVNNSYGTIVPPLAPGRFGQESSGGVIKVDGTDWP